MSKEHQYTVDIEWTGNLGSGTSHYTAYSRDHCISAADKASLAASSDPAFRGDKTRYNPEEFFLSALSSCHMLWYLHLCAEANIVVTAYEDHPLGVMVETPNTGGHFTSVLLRPQVTLAQGMDREKAHEIHHQTHQLCFLANSVNFPVHCEPVFL